MLEIKFSGRGGQGVVVASQILGLAFFKAGAYPQCYSIFGGERRGAPVVSYLRVDNKKILLKCEIERPQELICLDDSLIDPDEIKNLLDPGSKILINTQQPMKNFQKLKEFDLGLIDGLSISNSMGLGKIINTTILGAYCKFAGNIELTYLMEAVSENVPTQQEANLKAVQYAFDIMKT
jgi:2-oxoacid:acceptor oxidoreductase gamma subunit (pyruvate/2-ketoisovalerate family)